MKYAFDEMGTIGNKPCELVLNKILAEKNDPKDIRKTMRLLQLIKLRLKQLQSITDNAAWLYFRGLYIANVKDTVESITGTDLTQHPITDSWASHIMCVVNAYFLEDYHLRYPVKNKVRVDDNNDC